MRYKQPKSEGGANGIYGGIGSRPSPEVWTPGTEHAAADDEPVPRRFRRIFLRRPRYLDMQEREGGTSFWGFAVAFAIVFALLVVSIRTCSAHGMNVGP